ncbi:MAG: response regulator [Phycisphaerae bacterium]|nr:response regulator [Phycisphaerae bacterium]
MPSEPSGKQKILVADDEPHIIYILVIKLRSAGFEVVSAMDGQEALELAIQEKPDCIITDLQMPKLHGLEFCTSVREIPELADVPIIMLTAKGFEIDPAIAQSEGENADGDAIKSLVYTIMTKPFSMRELFATIEKALAGEPAAAASQNEVNGSAPAAHCNIPCVAGMGRGQWQLGDHHNRSNNEKEAGLYGAGHEHVEPADKG